MQSQYTHQLHRWGRTQTCSNCVSFFPIWKKQSSNWLMYELWKSFCLNSEVMNQMYDFAKDMTTHSAEVNVGKGVTGVVVKERHATDIKQVSIAYVDSNASPNVGAWLYLILNWSFLTFNCPVCDKRRRRKPCCAIDYRWCYVKYMHRVDFVCFLTCTFDAMTCPPKKLWSRDSLHSSGSQIMCSQTLLHSIFFIIIVFCLMQLCIMNGTDVRVGKTSTRVE